MKILLATLLVSVSATAAIAGSPSAVLPLPTLRPSLPISTAAAVTPTPAAETMQACDMHRVMRVDSGKVETIAGGFIIDAYGQSESAGWKKPQLALFDQDNGVATVDFVACRPDVSAQAITPIETHMGLGLAATTKHIILRGRTNTVTIDLTK
jgi:hypothetical protein